MKKLVILLTILTVAIGNCLSQDYPPLRMKNDVKIYGQLTVLGDSIGVTYINVDSIMMNSQMIRYIHGDTLPDIEWVKQAIQDSLLTFSEPFDATSPVTRTSFPTGEVLAGETVSDVLSSLLYPSVPPTTTLASSLGTTQEFMSAGADLTTDLTWSSTRPVACTPIVSITIDGVSQTLDVPFDEGHTQNDILSGRLVPRNTQTSFQNITNSQDKSSISTVTIVWRWKRYWGAFASAFPPGDPSFSISDAQILALTGAGVGSGNEFATSRQKTYNGIDGGGDYLVFAFPSSWGVPVFKINGLTSTAFTKVRDDAFINASGGTTTYQVWVSDTEYNSPVASFVIE